MLCCSLLKYEDPTRQEAARKTVPVDELEEKALVAIAKQVGMLVIFILLLLLDFVLQALLLFRCHFTFGVLRW